MKKVKNKVVKNIHTISFLVANKPGVLVRVALVFARRAFNIDSLVVSPSNDPRFSRMTITASGDLGTLDQIIKQANKLIDVIHASEHSQEHSIEKELALLKVRSKTSLESEVKKLGRRFSLRIDDKSEKYTIIEQTGTTEELDEFEAAIKKFGIVEMVRTGKILMARGREET